MSFNYVIKLQIVLIFLFFLFFLFSCATNKNIFIDPAVSKNSVTDSFTIVPLKNEWIYKSTKPNLEPLEEIIFNDRLTKAVASQTQSIVYSSENIDESIFIENAYQLVTMQNDELLLNLNVPNNSILNAIPTKYIVFFEDYDFQVAEVVENETSSFAGHDPSTHNILIFVCEFFIWDKSLNKIIAWGTLKESTKFGVTPELSDYGNVIRLTAQTLIQNSPFKKF